MRAANSMKLNSHWVYTKSLETGTPVVGFTTNRFSIKFDGVFTVDISTLELTNATL